MMDQLPKSPPEVPPLIVALKQDIDSLKERLQLCEDALREIWEIYQKNSGPS